MPRLTLDPNDDTPRYLQVEAALARALERGVWLPNGALPPERNLALELGVSRLTVRKALERLEERGAVTRRHGSGTFAAHALAPSRFEQGLGAVTGFSEDMRARGMQASSVWIERSVTLATPEEALALALSPGSRVSRLLRVRTADELPVAVEFAVLPVRFLPEPTEVTASLYAALEARGHRAVRALQRIRAVPLPEREAGLLGVPEGTPALHTHRLSYLEGGVVLEFTRAHYRADRYDFVVEMGGRAS